MVLRNRRLDLSRYISVKVHYFPTRLWVHGLKFSTELDLPKPECHQLLEHFTPQHMKKTIQRLFIRYISVKNSSAAIGLNSPSNEMLEGLVVRQDGEMSTKKVVVNFFHPNTIASPSFSSCSSSQLSLVNDWLLVSIGTML